MPESNITIGANRLRQFITSHEKLTILTGAGISSGSGIPTYRDRDGKWLAPQPITHQDFLSKEDKRKHYWIRSLLGWPFVRDARPNVGHNALANLETQGKVSLLITQNVDRLHQRAGSHAVLDLHGRIDYVVCVNCNSRVPRQEIQDWLHHKNSHITFDHIEIKPDGDVFLCQDFDYSKFEIPSCNECGGILKPDVVFFGGAIPKDRYTWGRDSILSSDAMIVIGSSLQVYSGYNFCRFANDNRKPIMIVNDGLTRADWMAEFKCEDDCLKLLDGYALD